MVEVIAEDEDSRRCGDVVETWAFAGAGGLGCASQSVLYGEVW